MYHKYFGLQCDPFRLSPVNKQCYQHKSYKQAWAYIQYALHKREGIVLFTGDPGMGKTSLITELANNFIESRISITNLTCSNFDAADLLRLIARGVGLNLNTENKAILLESIENVFLDLRCRQKRYPVLILDEAQTLSIEALEQVRLLTNMNWKGTPLLQVYLVGQRNLRDIVLSPELEQLHQRIIVSAALEPLGGHEIRGYVEHRLKMVGWHNDPELSEDIYPYVLQYSLGIPRWVNLIFSRLLLHGMVEELHELGVQELRQVLKDLAEEDLLPNQVRAAVGSSSR